MKVRQPFNELVCELSYCFLGQALVLLNKLVEVSTRAIFKNDPEMVAGLVPIVELEDILVLQVVEDADFVHQLAAARALDRLDRDVLDALLDSALVDH